MWHNAQTQHGDYRTVDEENIVVLRNCVSPPLESVLQFADNSVENDQETSPESVVCVWKFPWKSPRLECHSEINVDVQASNSEKRKLEDEVDLPKEFKKSKSEGKNQKTKRPGFAVDRYNETSYYFENGLRKVYPYFFTFTTYTKGRWIGEKILDVFAREFRAHPAEEYHKSINCGSLTVNYEKIPIDYILKHNDLLANVVHRHEVPVTGKPITIVHIDNDIVVVNKPASIPVHPCGRYRHNTVVFILAKEYNLRDLRTIHRLDRLTSGILLFGRNPEKARELEHQIRNRLVKKKYVCRVNGEFPEESIECKEPIEVVSYKIGVCKVSDKGKDCHTIFKRLSYNGRTSVVQCEPHTGRMHQIRVHLQYLGFPIMNDPLYNHEVFGPYRGRGGDMGGKTDEQLIKDLISIHSAENWLGSDGGSEISLFTTSITTGEIEKQNVNICETTTNITNEQKNVGESRNVAIQTGHEEPDMKFNATKFSVDENCYECKVNFKDPQPQDLIMFLHAWKYSGINWQYETELPDWAGVDWTDEV